jgi:thiosulfate dehydrogenase [quinone] large subunit
MANNPKLLIIINQINIWGLILIGVSLFTGFFSKLFKVFAIAILLLYYFAYPPFHGILINAPVEGSYWIVNKNLIEIASIIVLYLFPTSHITGIDRFFQPKTRHHEN